MNTNTDKYTLTVDERNAFINNLEEADIQRLKKLKQLKSESTNEIIKDAQLTDYELGYLSVYGHVNISENQRTIF